MVVVEEAKVGTGSVGEPRHGCTDGVLFPKAVMVFDLLGVWYWIWGEGFEGI